jgi:hypothetical protein
MATRVKKKHFSSFTYAEAFKYLGIKKIDPWRFAADPLEPSAFFHERLRRMAEVFDLQNCEESKKLTIDAICEEVLQGFQYLKLWKGASLADEQTSGYVDYLMAERKAYLEAPFLCIVEAKKDDFEQGLAQCLPEMKACQYSNQILGQNLDIYGIVTNGNSWEFYCLKLDGKVYGTQTYSLGSVTELLGAIHHVFQQCEQNLLIVLENQS